MTYADRSNGLFDRLLNRVVAADAMHQCGRRVEAGALFAEAELMQKEIQPDIDVLYSGQGYLILRVAAGPC